jgi:hypothetical protein
MTKNRDVESETAALSGSSTQRLDGHSLSGVGSSTAEWGGQALMGEFDVVRITGLSVSTIRRYRLLGCGPKFLKIGAAVRYRPEDLAAFLNSRPTGGGQ